MASLIILSILGISKIIHDERKEHKELKAKKAAKIDLRGHARPEIVDAAPAYSPAVEESEEVAPPAYQKAYAAPGTAMIGARGAGERIGGSGYVVERGVVL